MADPGSRYITKTAREGALALRMTEADIVQTVLGLQPADFYKSMTTYGENKMWQDVYKPFAQGVPIYLKVQILQERGIVISFKEA